MSRQSSRFRDFAQGLFPPATGVDIRKPTPVNGYKRASWKSQEEFRTHVMASWPEYNHRYARPVEWTWTNYKMRQWFAKHASGI